MRAVAALVATLCATSCIDNDFRIDQVSTEITVGGEELVVPLGELERTTLGDIVGDDMEFLKSDENGLFTISFSSFGDNPDKWEQFSIDGVTLPTLTNLSPEKQSISFSTGELPTTLNMSGITTTTTINYPTLGQIIAFAPIEMTQKLDLDLPVSGSGTLNDNVAAMLPNLTYSYVGKTSFRAVIDVPDEVKKLDFILFGDDTHPHGAPFDIMLDLNGIAGLNGGTTLDLDFIFPEGYYLRDSNGRDLDIHNHLITTVTIEAGKPSAALHLYLHKIDYSNEQYLPGSHTIDIHDEIEYHIDLSTKLTGGMYDMTRPAEFSMKATPMYKDVEIVVDHFTVPAIETPVTYAFDGLTDDIEIKSIAFASAPISLQMTGIEWLTADVYTRIMLPSCFKFKAENNPSNFDVTTNCLTATIDQLHDGITLNLDSIDCTTSECRHANGRLEVNAMVRTELDTHLLDGHEVLLSQVMPPQSTVSVTTTLGGGTLRLDTQRCEVVFGSEQVFNFDLSEQLPTISQEVSLPKEIVAIDELTIGKAGAAEPVHIALNLATQRGKRFPVDEVQLDFSVNLGKMLRPTQRMFDEGIIVKADNGDNLLIIKQAWRPNDSAFDRTIEIEALENLPSVGSDGVMRIEQSFPVTGKVMIADGQNIDLSSTNAAIDVAIAIDDIEIKRFTGKIGVEAAPTNLPRIELGDLSTLGINLQSIKINPVIRFTLKDNPVGVPFMANIGLQCFNAEGTPLKNITIPQITVNGTGRSEIILSTSANRPLYEGKEGITFVCADELATLLEGELPSSIAIDMNVRTDSTTSYTLELANAKDGFAIEYQYDVAIPLSFDGDLDVSYSGRVTGFNSTFSQLSEFELGVEDVAILADVRTNIPLSLILQASLIDINGNKIENGPQLYMGNSVIGGYKPEDGDYRTSQLEIGLQLGEEASTTALRNVDGIELNIMLCNTDGTKSELRADQFIEGDVKLRVRGGVTIDLKEILAPTIEE